jgi:hypothetical protein
MARIFIGAIAAAATALAMSAASADDMAMVGTFGNTVQVKTPSGDVSYYFDQNGTFKRNGGGGGEGVWTVKGDKVCTTVAGQSEECELEIKNGEVGQSWQQSFKGAQATVQIVEGR